MKRIFAVLVLAAFVCASCAESKNICFPTGECKTFEPYGLMDKSEARDERVAYEISTGNIVLAVVFSETIIVPLVVARRDRWARDVRCGGQWMRS